MLYTLKDTSYFYFTSDKSGIVELFGWLEANYAACNPFHGSTRVERKSRINHNSVYTDIMIYKKRRNQ